MKIAAACFTQSGMELGEMLRRSFDGLTLTRCSENTPLSDWTRENFASCDALVFIGAAGITVRAIAPYVASKVSDPAVIVIDDCGKNVIPLLSGHIGGANSLARALAQKIGANAIITTATDNHGVFAIDEWAARQGFHIDNPDRIKFVSSKLLEGEEVAVKSDFPISGTLPKGMILDVSQPDVAITFRSGEPDTLNIIPSCLSLGIGCRRGTSKQAIAEAFSLFCQSQNLNRLAFCAVFSIDLKKDEAGLLAFCKDQGLSFQTFTAEELEGVDGNFSKSDFVKETTGTDCVCERSAVLGSGGRLIAGKTISGGVTLAAAVNDLKLSFKEGA